jgi:fatty-acyl-CoA synthase
VTGSDLLMNNRPEWVETFFGALPWPGAVVVAFSTWSKREELAYLIEDSGIRLLVTLDQFSGQNFRRRSANDAAARCRVARRRPRPWLAAVPGDAGRATGRRRECPREPEGDAIIIYTSGSSSRPKSVPLSHGGIIENGFNIGERQGYTSAIGCCWRRRCSGPMAAPTRCPRC